MNILRHQNLALPGIAHGFFGRAGGVSRGVLASLNCGPGSRDDREALAENRRRAADAIVPGAPLLTLSQVHGPMVVTVDAQTNAPWAMGDGAEADAMATRERGVVLGILTADCAPVLLADAGAGVIGAAHAGWKGALAGVTDAVIEAMEALGARRARIVAAIGPCIGQAAYEIGPEMRGAFIAADAGNARFFAPSARVDHFRFALEDYVAARLEMAGIGEPGRLSTCTHAHEADYFSYRRTTQRGEADYGRQVSAIALLP